VYSSTSSFEDVKSLPFASGPQLLRIVYSGDSGSQTFSVNPGADYRCISRIKTSLDFALEVWEMTPESPNSHRKGVGGFRVPLE